MKFNSLAWGFQQIYIYFKNKIKSAAMARFSVKYNFWDKNCIFTLWVEEKPEGNIVTPLWPSVYKLTGKDDGSSWEEDGVAGISPDATEEREMREIQETKSEQGNDAGWRNKDDEGWGNSPLGTVGLQLVFLGFVTVAVCMRVSGHAQINWAMRLAGQARSQSLKQLHKERTRQSAKLSAAYTDEQSWTKDVVSLKQHWF